MRKRICPGSRRSQTSEARGKTWQLVHDEAGKEKLCQELRKLKPNLIVSIHAPYGVLDFDGLNALIGTRELLALGKRYDEDAK